MRDWFPNETEKGKKMTLRNETLRAGLSDPRFWLNKDNWDKRTPRWMVEEAVLALPAWNVTFGEDGIDRGFEVAVVTNFPFEGPVATVKVGEVEKTLKGDSLEDLCDEVIRVALELLSTDPDPVDDDEEVVETSAEDTYWNDLTDKQRKDYEKEWVADYARETGCTKSDASFQYDRWLDQEGWTSRDAFISHRREVKWLEAGLEVSPDEDMQDYPMQWEDSIQWGDA